MLLLTALLFSMLTLVGAGLAWSISCRSIEFKILTLTVVFSFVFWYCLPGDFFLMGSAADSKDSFLYDSFFNITQAVLLSITCFFVLLTVPFFLSYKKKQGPTSVNLRKLNLLIFLIFISAVFRFYILFREFGFDFIFKIIIGVSTPREVMSFENFSNGYYQSFMAFWDIENIFIGVSLAATLAWERKILSLSFVFSILIVLISFISSGTRSILLLLLFSIFVSIICRPKQLVKVNIKKHNSIFYKIVICSMFSGLLFLAVSSVTSRFNDVTENNSLVLQNIGENNDMLRELVFVFANDKNSDVNPIPFISTPFTFLMPRFLGFDKKVPSHLINFNMDREGIDVLWGAGNVFPGIIADMYMCFGIFAVATLPLFTIAYFFTSYWVTVRSRINPFNYGLFVALQSYYFISFRNIQGSLSFLVISAFILSYYFAGSLSKAKSTNS